MGESTARKLSPRDGKTLARLVAKYGRRVVVEAAQKVRSSARPGRRRDDEARGELWAHVEWIEHRAGELRDDGHPHGALHVATHERFLAVTPRDQQNDEVELEKFKRKIQRAREGSAADRRAISRARKASHRSGGD